MSDDYVPQNLPPHLLEKLQQAIEPSPLHRSRRRIHLSTAENVGKLFEQDWVILIGSKDGEVHFVPWLSANTPEDVMAEWLALLADARRRPTDQASPVTKGP